MPNPKRKHSGSRRDSRRSANWKLEKQSPAVCPQCRVLRRAHNVCPSCGFYNGKLEMVVKSAKDKKEDNPK